MYSYLKKIIIEELIKTLKESDPEYLSAFMRASNYPKIKETPKRDKSSLIIRGLKNSESALNFFKKALRSSDKEVPGHFLSRQEIFLDDARTELSKVGKDYSDITLEDIKKVFHSVKERLSKKEERSSK